MPHSGQNFASGRQLGAAVRARLRAERAAALRAELRAAAFAVPHVGHGDRRGRRSRPLRRPLPLRRSCCGGLLLGRCRLRGRLLHLAGLDAAGDVLADAGADEQAGHRRAVAALLHALGRAEHRLGLRRRHVARVAGEAHLRHAVLDVEQALAVGVVHVDEEVLDARDLQAERLEVRRPPPRRWPSRTRACTCRR